MSIGYETISKRFTDVIGGSKVTRALFTTYNFEPDFFETEIIPLLLPGSTEYSRNELLKHFQVETLLRESGIRIDVFYDANIYEYDSSPLLEYGCFGVGVAGAFHPKLMVLELEDDGEARIVVGAGSCNLSQAGWWENIECLHFVELTARGAPKETVRELRKALRYLRDHCHQQPSATIDNLLGKLNSLEKNGRDMRTGDPRFYFSPNRKSGGFLGFLDEQLPNVNRKRLELISPYFADDPKDDIHCELRERLGVGELALYLPRDLSRNPVPALVSETYYERLEADEAVRWCDWCNEPKSSLTNGDVYRKVHAKLYHFMGGSYSYLFVGSVNFSNMAFRTNVEAGFLVRLPRVAELLETAPPPDHFEEPSDLRPGDRREDIQARPKVSLRLDWVSRTLCAGNGEQTEVWIALLSATGEVLFSEARVPAEGLAEWQVDEAALDHFARTGLISAIVRAEDAEPWRGWLVVQQVNTELRPFELPAMSPRDILLAYLNLERGTRLPAIVNALEQQLRRLGRWGDESGTLQVSNRAAEGFMSRFAQINSAFWRLGEALKQAEGNNDQRRFDYYLKSDRPDSLLGLLKAVSQEDDRLEVVEEFLVMLWMRQLLQEHGGADCAALSALVEECYLQAKEGLEIETLDKDEFLAWFEQEFAPVAEDQTA